MPRSLNLLLIVVVMDQLDFGMATPLYPLLFIDPDSPTLLVEPERAASIGNGLIAALTVAYALPAFLLQPILGQPSDRYGRKPLLLASFVSSTVSYGLFAVGLRRQSLH